MAKFYAANIQPKISQLEASARLNALNLLKGPWTITCAKCGLSFQMEVTTEGLGNLLSSKHMQVECQNPTWRHKISISLKDLIERRIASTL